MNILFFTDGRFFLFSILFLTFYLFYLNMKES